MSEQTTIPAAVGQQVRRIREANGHSQDALAAAARRAGMDWTRAAVASLETGRRGLSAEELLLLPLALVHLDGAPHTLAELLEGTSTVVRPTGEPAGTDYLRHLVNGGDAAAGGAFERQMAEGMDPHDARAVAYMAAREAERHAAHILGVDAEHVASTAASRYGHGLTEERERRLERRADPDASARSLQAIRGHVTRELLDELRHDLEDRNDR